MVYHQVLSGENEKHYIALRNIYKKTIGISLIIFDIFFVIQNPRKNIFY